MVWNQLLWKWQGAVDAASLTIYTYGMTESGHKWVPSTVSKRHSMPRVDNAMYLWIFQYWMSVWASEKVVGVQKTSIFGQEPPMKMICTTSAAGGCPVIVCCSETKSAVVLDKNVWPPPLLISLPKERTIVANPGKRLVKSWCFCFVASWLVLTCLLHWQGDLLATFEPNSFQNHDLSVSHDGRFISVGTFTADAKVWEVEYKHGSYKGCPKVMDLKGHSSQIMSVAFTMVSFILLPAKGQYFDCDCMLLQLGVLPFQASIGLGMIWIRVPRNLCFSHKLIISLSVASLFLAGPIKHDALNKRWGAL